MPDIDFCSRCGKEILTSRYSWSDLQLICKSCSEQSPRLPIEQNPPLDYIDDSFTKHSYLHTSKLEDEDKMSHNHEIIITWPYVIKFLLTGLFFALILGFSFKGLRFFERDVPSGSVQKTSRL